MRFAFLYNFFASAGKWGEKKGNDKKIFQHVGKISKREKTSFLKIVGCFDVFSFFKWLKTGDTDRCPELERFTSARDLKLVGNEK
jgi:hypothetical protein